MLLNDYLDSIKTTPLNSLNKPWVSEKLINDEFLSNIYPDAKAEEWKYFNTKFFMEKEWKLLRNTNDLSFQKIKDKSKNSLVIKNGFLDETQSTISSKNKINIFKLKDYYKKNKSIIDKIYSDSNKYSENRISGFKDCKTIKLLSLNSLLNEGIVIDIPPNTINDIDLYICNYITTEETLINPYILIIAGENSETKIIDLTDYLGDKNWTNFFYEAYLENNSSLKISNLSLNQSNNLNTSSYNFHLKDNSSLKFASINKGNSKKDLRVFLNGNNATTNIKGMLLSREEETSDVFCKVTHNNTNTKSNQDWRMISSDHSKTSLNGKIRIIKSSKKSSGNFLSKSLLLNDKSSSISKPELEIFEDEVSCSHGSSVGEIEKEKLFYLQSRGLSRTQAIRVLVLAFINELEFNDKNVEENFIKDIDDMFSRQDL